MNLWCRLESGTSSCILSSCSNQSNANVQLSVSASSLNLTPRDRTFDSISSSINVSSRNPDVDVVVSDEVVVVVGSSVVVAASVVASVDASDISSKCGWVVVGSDMASDDASVGICEVSTEVTVDKVFE
jgi:hypothetical protein